MEWNGIEYGMEWNRICGYMSIFYSIPFHSLIHSEYKWNKPVHVSAAIENKDLKWDTYHTHEEKGPLATVNSTQLKFYL